MFPPRAPFFCAAQGSAEPGLPAGKAGLRPQTARTEGVNGRQRDLFGAIP
jgi:hypothetical protein